MNWDAANFATKLNILEGASTVLVGLLLENATLCQMVRRGESFDTCLEFVNDNF